MLRARTALGLFEIPLFRVGSINRQHELKSVDKHKHITLK